MAGPAERWWRLPQAVSVRLVDTEEALENARGLLDAALCCAIDAEWPPEQTVAEAEQRGGPPQATLVQLALWLPPVVRTAAADGSNGCSANGSTSNGSSGRGGTCCVLLLDMLGLPQAASKQALQTVFRNKGCLKLGFGLVHDLRAIAAALGGEGGSCIAVVEPACDVGSTHRFLRHRRVPGVNKAVDLGLSGLVEAQLGLPLDKEQQCSTWGKRPLSAAQREYAAADAACLLGLLGSLVLAVGQPEEWPMTEDASEGEAATTAAAAAAAAVPVEEEGSAEAGAGREGSGGGQADGDVGVEKEEEERHELEPSEGQAEATREQQQQSKLLQQPGQPQAEQQEQGQPQAGQQAQAQAQAQVNLHPSTVLLAACSTQQLRAAAAAWAVRLEISGSKAVRRGGKRGSQRPRQQRQAGGSLPRGGTGFPLHVPWMDAQRQLTGPPRFLCDIMVEGLARQLRLCGFDAESLQDSMERSPRHAIYRSMTERGEAEGRVVLTRDRTYVGANYSDQAFLVQSDTKRAQLEEVLAAFALNVTREDLLTRCARCNGNFLEEPFPAGLLPEGHGVPPGILQRHDEFWVCERCQAVFWQGNQYSRAKEQMTELIARMDAACLAGAGSRRR